MCVQRVSKRKENSLHILLTGAGGQLGHAVQGIFSNHTVVACDRRQLDITHLDAVRAAAATYAPDLVLNAAAYNAVDQAEQDPEAAYRGNALGPRNLALVTASRGIPLLHLSTNYVFDGLSRRPYHEFDTPHPQSVYGHSKLAGEEAVRALNPKHYIVRTCWVYHTHGKNFVQTMRALSQQPEVRVVNDQFGSPTYAPHLATALARLVTTEAFGTYHLAGRGGTSRFDLIQTLYALLGVRSQVKPIPSTEMPRLAKCPSYAVLTTLQEPAIQLPPWQDGLTQFVQSAL